MGEFFTILSQTWGFLKLQMNLYGITVSFWDIALWAAVIGLLMSFTISIVLASSKSSPAKGAKK